MLKIVVALVLSAYLVIAGPSLTNTDATVKETLIKCAMENNLPYQQFLDNVKNGQHDSSTKKFIHCFYKILNIINDNNTINMDIASEYIRREYGDKAGYIIENCLKTKQHAIETAFAVRLCIGNAVNNKFYDI
ncbi:unnamed protein product [Diabrotica balteata]|uniref:Uncharacterized protein n=1 Tax=Diabrotica balteata TaxID=107213 RepID=A0A9N9XBQ3_DIABA|nr:unnamed protein product [Diabrotica balteata]